MLLFIVLFLQTLNNVLFDNASISVLLLIAKSCAISALSWASLTDIL